jgi:hypothetical protein
MYDLPLANNGIVLHARECQHVWMIERSSNKGDLLAHAQHSINLLDPKPMENVWHECLESHILYTSNILGALEVVGCAIGPTFASVIDDLVQHQRKCPRRPFIRTTQPMTYGTACIISVLSLAKFGGSIPL